MADAWRPTSELERRLHETVRAGDPEAYFRLLAESELVLPVPPDLIDDVLANQAQPTWPTQDEDGRTHVLAYTSPAAMRACLGPAYQHFVRLKFADLAQSWPHPRWWLAVDAPARDLRDVALPIEGRLPGWFVRQLADGDPRPPRAGRPLAAPAAVPSAGAPSQDAPSSVPNAVPTGVPTDGQPSDVASRDVRSAEATGAHALPTVPRTEPAADRTAAPASAGDVPAPGDVPGASEPATPAVPNAAQGPSAPASPAAAPNEPPAAPPVEPPAPPAPETSPAPQPSDAQPPAAPAPDAQGPAAGDAPAAQPSAPAEPSSGGGAEPPADLPAPGDRLVARAPAPPPAPDDTLVDVPAIVDEPAAESAPWEELQDQHRDLPPRKERRSQFRPANDVERELLRAAANNDHDLFLQTLADAELLLPVPEDTDYTLRPGRPGFPWLVREVEGGPVVPVFTSPERLMEAAEPLGFGREFIRVPFTVLLRYWPDDGHALAVNSGSPAGGTVVAQQLPGLARWADQRAARRLSENFEPQNDVERKLFEAATRRDTDAFFKILLGAQVLVPADPETPWGITPDDPEFPWGPVRVHGAASVQVFTSLKWMNEALGSSRFVMPGFLDMVAAWPDAEWTLVLNPGTPIDATMPGEQVRALSGTAGTAASPGEKAAAPPAASPAASEPAASAEAAASVEAAAPPAAPAEQPSGAPSVTTPDLGDLAGLVSADRSRDAEPSPAPRAEDRPPSGEAPHAPDRPRGAESPLDSGPRRAPEPPQAPDLPRITDPLAPGRPFAPEPPPASGQPHAAEPAPSPGQPLVPEPPRSPESAPAPETTPADASRGAPPAETPRPVEAPPAAGAPPVGSPMGMPPAPEAPQPPAHGPDPRPADRQAGPRPGEQAPAAAAPPEQPARQPADEPEFEPGNRIDQELYEAAQSGDSDAFLRVLLAANVLVPIPQDAPLEVTPVQREFRWDAAMRGTSAVQVFTSLVRLREVLPESRFVYADFRELIASWPREDWAMLLNPGTRIGASLSGDQVRSLSEWAMRVGLMPPRPEPLASPSADPLDTAPQSFAAADAPQPQRPETAPAATEPEPQAAPYTQGARPAVPEPDPERTAQPVIMQKVVPHGHVSWYLEQGYDRVGGFVHPAVDVAELQTPVQLYEALGLLYEGSPFSPGDEGVYVIRWPAYCPDLYRIPFGGQTEEERSAWGDAGWVIERPPFHGNGFAPGSAGSIREYKVDSVRLPYGAEMYYLGMDRSERFVAMYDPDQLAWLRPETPPEDGGGARGGDRTEVPR
ncbi:UNVERIFIED_ORG: type III secretion system (T3SS) SseB-like protein [Actinomadura viridilutea]